MKKLLAILFLGVLANQGGFAMDANPDFGKPDTLHNDGGQANEKLEKQKILIGSLENTIAVKEAQIASQKNNLRNFFQKYLSGKGVAGAIVAADSKTDPKELRGDILDIFFVEEKDIENYPETRYTPEEQAEAALVEKTKAIKTSLFADYTPLVNVCSDVSIKFEMGALGPSGTYNNMKKNIEELFKIKLVNKKAAGVNKDEVAFNNLDEIVGAKTDYAFTTPKNKLFSLLSIENVLFAKMMQSEDSTGENGSYIAALKYSKIRKLAEDVLKALKDANSGQKEEVKKLFEPAGGASVNSIPTVKK